MQNNRGGSSSPPKKITGGTNGNTAISIKTSVLLVQGTYNRIY